LNTYAQGGTIKGKVTDKQTSEPLIGANVIVMLTQLGAATDIDGYYEIQNIFPGTYDIKVSNLGYSSVTLEGARVTNAGFLILDFELEEDFSLPSIKIVNKKFDLKKVVPSCGQPWSVDMIPIREIYYLNIVERFKLNPPELKPVVVKHPSIEN
jgi:hypothetical protein